MRRWGCRSDISGKSRTGPILKAALIAALIISVPPADYAAPSCSLHIWQKVFTVPVSRRSFMPMANRLLRRNVVRSTRAQSGRSRVRELNHESWAVHDAATYCDIIHVQSAQAATLSCFIQQPVVLTLHGPHEATLSEVYRFYPEVYYVGISEAQCKQEAMPRMRTIHHGIDLNQYGWLSRNNRT